jgi:hypothetical protein
VFNDRLTVWITGAKMREKTLLQRQNIAVAEKAQGVRAAVPGFVVES